MEFLDYYKILEVPRDATPEQIKASYRKLARQWHPDTYQGTDRSAAEEKFKQISEAYEVLSDAQQRVKYDQLGRDWRAGRVAAGAGAGRGAGQAGQAGRSMSPEEFEQVFGGRGFSDFFTTFFGGDFASRFGQRPRQHAGVRRAGADVRATIEVPVALAVAGGKRAFEIEAQTQCSTCDGAGTLEDDHVCPACGGLGRRHGRRAVTVMIPKDVRDGQTIRLKGLGEIAGDGAPAGDLYLTVKLVGDGVWEPRGDDVHADLPVAPWEAALGAKVSVRTPISEVVLTIPPGSNSGARLRVRGHGLRRTDGTRGDFHARIVITLPRSLSEKQKKLLEELRDAGGPGVRE